MTYHTAKGLEWPIVILYSLNWTKKLRERIFQTRALSVDHFLPENPLEGRSIHCWPYPFGKSEIDELKAKLEEEAGKESLVKKLNDLVKDTEFKVFSDALASGGDVRGICIDDASDKFSI